jgi:hypothetical protein
MGDTRPFHLELGATARETPSQTRNDDRRQKHAQVPETHMHTGWRPGNDLTGDGTITMARKIEVDQSN